MGEVKLFTPTQRAPLRFVWVCPLCGRHSRDLYPNYQCDWTDICMESAVVVEIEKLIFNFSVTRVISMKGDDGAKYAKLAEMIRIDRIQKGKTLLHA
jgi:hypothetical protein